MPWCCYGKCRRRPLSNNAGSTGRFSNRAPFFGAAATGSVAPHRYAPFGGGASDAPDCNRLSPGSRAQLARDVAFFRRSALRSASAVAQNGARLACDTARVARPRSYRVLAERSCRGPHHRSVASGLARLSPGARCGVPAAWRRRRKGAPLAPPSDVVARGTRISHVTRVATVSLATPHASVPLPFAFRPRWGALRSTRVRGHAAYRIDSANRSPSVRSSSCV